MLSDNIDFLDTFWPWRFKVQFNQPVWGHEIRGPVNECWVLRLCEFAGPSIVTSPCEPVPFLDFVKDLPPPRQPRATGEEGGGGASSSGSRAAPAAGSMTPETPEAATPAAAATGEPAAALYEEMDDSELAELRNWLEKKKEEMSADREVSQVHFEAACVGSQWTARNRGVGSDVARAGGTTAAASRWAKETLGNEMASFSLKLYSPPVACVLYVF